MSLSALGKFILPPVIAAAGVFSAMSLPLAMMGDKPVGIRYEEEPVFDGRIRDIAPPYVVFVTALSFGVGIGVAAIGGWRTSARKSSLFQHQLTTLEDDLQQKDKLLKELKLSESRLQVSGLASFLDDEVPFDQPALKALPAVVNQPVVQEPVIAQTSAQKYQQYSPSSVPTMAPKPMATPKVAARVMPSQPTTVTSVASSFASAASAQAFLNYDKPNQVADKASVNDSHIQPLTSEGSFEAIQQQLREMMEQMRAMQNSMQQIPQGASVQTTPNKFQVYYEAPNSSETRFQ
ncbi:hypothetical protein DSM106972_088520 [Dulcicalothrix desertica PCC 7102]|uniref:Uncharacterized protein n=1 Tax=Dulcicalothrix desertica PCC 7102 TaxID=232991 RepID=A0A433UQQ3_9CYAN|nr:hypothetical protein [Dulcicalothrix desertica]RUS96181.1 hypothetical protein DSM106972_088520 [Dulcicalothrix desertica PCC 7102]TWH53937.1 hypothetical protein CAL7102_01934 [Dulcicalothrix desertica PCC 7102]